MNTRRAAEAGYSGEQTDNPTVSSQETGIYESNLDNLPQESCWRYLGCEFTVVYDLLFRPIFIFVILELKTRLIIHSAVTRSPSDAWTAQQLREATPWGSHPKVLIRDRDRKYGPLFSSVATCSGIQEVKMPCRAPKANAVCERFMGCMRRECLDHTFVLNQRHLERVVKEYGSYYNDARPHQGIQQRIPGRYGEKESLTSSGKLVLRLVLGGPHHDYSPTAYLN